MKKIGATDWTIGKLMAIILAVVLLVLIIYGFSTGAMTPLKDRIIGMWDNVLSMFGWGGNGGGEDCYVSSNLFVYEIGNKKVYGDLTFCKEYCELDLDKSISYFFETPANSYTVEKRSFRLDKENILRTKNQFSTNDWFVEKVINEEIINKENIELAREQRKAFQALRAVIPGTNNYEEFKEIGGAPETSLMFKIEPRGLFGKTFYVEWTIKRWEIWKEGDESRLQVNFVDWNDGEALKYIWDESTRGINDVVYLGERVWPSLPAEWYEIGKISNADKFAELQRLFEQKKNEVSQQNVPSEQELGEFKGKLLEQEILFKGQKQEVDVELQQIGDYQYVLLYFSPANKQYGLVYDFNYLLNKDASIASPLALLKYNSESEKWEVVDSEPNKAFWVLIEDDLAESYIEVAKVNEFLMEKCR